MIEKSLPGGVRPATPEETRAGRALRLYVEHAETIALSFRAGVYRVPSCTGTAVYTVRLVPRPYCSCRDFAGGGNEPCKHVLATQVVKARTSPCSSCGRRFRDRELVEVTQDHGSLTWFEGDRLCEGCVADHGGIS